MPETEKTLTVHIFKSVLIDGSGNLTSDGKEILKKVKGIPFSQKCYIGPIFESLATAREIMGMILANIPKKERPFIEQKVGSNRLIEKLLCEGDEEIIKVFLDFLQAKKDEGLKQILIITSPIYALIMKYVEIGKVRRMGSLRDFVNHIDEAIQWEGTKIPLVARGDYETFKF